MGKPTEALAAFEKGRAIRQALADANPRVNMFQRDLALSLAQIGMLRRDAGHSAETEPFPSRFGLGDVCYEEHFGQQWTVGEEDD